MLPSWPYSSVLLLSRYVWRIHNTVRYVRQWRAWNAPTIIYKEDGRNKTLCTTASPFLLFMGWKKEQLDCIACIHGLSAKVSHKATAVLLILPRRSNSTFMPTLWSFFCVCKAPPLCLIIEWRILLASKIQLQTAHKFVVRCSWCEESKRIALTLH